MLQDLEVFSYVVKLAPSTSSGTGPQRATAAAFSLLDFGAAGLETSTGIEVGVGPSRLKLSGATAAAWCELLSRYEWAWFFTATFKDAIHPEAADKKFKHWVGQVAGSYLGERWRQRPSKIARAPMWVRGLEWQKREVLHYHALVTNVPREFVEWEHRKHWCDQWSMLDGAGFAWCDPYTGRDACFTYLTKYVTKGGEIDVSPNLSPSSLRLALH